MIYQRLKKYLDSNKKDKDIFDIVVYGSATKTYSKPNDVDLLVIFSNELSLEKRLNKIQKIKEKIKKEFNNIDIKQIVLRNLFEEKFLARTGIFLDGYSLFREKAFSEMLGFKAYSLYDYDISQKTHTEKVKFNYILQGRTNQGILEMYDAKKVSNNLIKVPINKSKIFEEILNYNKIKFKKTNVLEEI